MESCEIFRCIEQHLNFGIVSINYLNLFKPWPAKILNYSSKILLTLRFISRKLADIGLHASGCIIAL